MREKDNRGGTDTRFVVFSDDWGVHPSSCQHIFRRIAKDYEVTWVNTVGMRGPKLTLSDLRKIREKISRMLSVGGSARENDTCTLSVLQPAMLPFMSSGMVRKFNRWSVARALRSAVPERSNKRTVVVTTVPNAADYVDLISAERVVYYCVDDFSEWPGLSKELILSMESNLLEKTDLVLATSPQIKNRLANKISLVEMLEHGVDVEHFSTLIGPEHSCLVDIPRPRVGFFGLFDDRIDKELVQQLSQENSDVNFVFAGPVDTKIESLKGIKNIHFVGRMAYEKLPEFIFGLDMLIIPYKVNALAESLSPLKLKEYLATGKPIITSHLPAAIALQDYLAIANTIEDWTAQFRLQLQDDTRLDNRNMPSWLFEFSWQNRADEFLKHCHCLD